MHGGAPFGVRFSEVANVLQLWYFQSVTRQVSVVAFSEGPLWEVPLYMQAMKA